MKIDVKYVAKLARLELTPEEEDKFARQLSGILEYMEKLDSADTSGVEPLSHVLGLKNALREDKPDPEIPDSGPGKEILENAPDSEGRYFKVKKVIE